MRLFRDSELGNETLNGNQGSLIVQEVDERCVARFISGTADLDYLASVGEDGMVE